MGKTVELTKGQHRAIKLYLKNHGTEQMLFHEHANDIPWVGHYEPLNDLSLYEMATAILVGYTVRDGESNA